MKKRILIIEDDASTVRGLLRVLAKYGYDEVDVLIGVDSIEAPGGILKGFNHSADVEVDLNLVAVTFLDGIIAGTHMGWQVAPTLLKYCACIAMSGTNQIDQIKAGCKPEHACDKLHLAEFIKSERFREIYEKACAEAAQTG